jgi:hypothetical protein
MRNDAEDYPESYLLYVFLVSAAIAIAAAVAAVFLF